MHLVFLNQYYPPDAAPTGVMLQAVVERLVEDGHEVTVICADGGYAKGGGNVGHRSEEACSGASATVAGFPASNSRISILRIGATRFGRGTFVGKLLDYASYYVVGGWRLLTVSRKPDRIVALTTPPYLSVLARLVSKLRGADHAHWVMDLYPEVMVAHGMLAEGGWKHRVLAGIARWGFGGGRCAAVLTLGPDMAERVGRLNTEYRSEEPCRGVSVTVAGIPDPNHQPSPIHWVPLWGSDGGTNERGHSCPPSSHSDSHATLLRRARGWADDDLVVMYSGNMGLGHRFGEFLEAAGKANIERRSEEPGSGASGTVAGVSTPDSQPSPGIRFVFYGRGKRRGEIEAFVREHPECRIELHDYAAAENLTAHLQSADVHLASLDAAWSGTMVPSKLQGIFAVGRPVIFVGSVESSIGRWITESGGGWVVEPEDGAGLAAALAEAGDPETCKRRGDAASAYARRHFDKATNAARVAAIFTR